MDLLAGDVLLIVDVQNDLLPGGRMGVRHALECIAPLNRYAAEFGERALPIFASRDWHPPNHCSFADHGGVLPPHCLVGSAGADFPASLILPKATQLVSKGTFHLEEGDSAFEGTNLAHRLRTNGCRRLFIGGLTTDGAVLRTGIDALRLGLQLVILQDAVRAAEVLPGDEAQALGDIVAVGGQLASLPEFGFGRSRTGNSPERVGRLASFGPRPHAP